MTRAYEGGAMNAKSDTPPSGSIEEINVGVLSALDDVNGMLFTMYGLATRLYGIDVPPPSPTGTQDEPYGVVDNLQQNVDLLRGAIDDLKNAMTILGRL